MHDINLCKYTNSDSACGWLVEVVWTHTNTVGGVIPSGQFLSRISIGPVGPLNLECYYFL